MLIGIDANEANHQNRVGIGQFAWNVITYLEKIDKKNSYLIYLKKSPIADLPKSRNNWQYLVFGPGKYWTQFALPLKLLTQKIKPDIFFSPSHYGPRFSPIPSVVSLMDLWHHRHPEQFTKKDLYQLTNWEKYSVKKASHIITISEFSKREIISIYKLPEEKVTVVYPGYTKIIPPSAGQISNIKNNEIGTKYGIKSDYFLYLGTLQPKKNVEGLIKAFSLLITNYQSPITLVIAGKKGWLYEEIFELVKKLKLDDKVIFTGFVEEEEKQSLMVGAKAFVIPSFYEGFGIPVLESMNQGVPVIASSEGSLPEVGGKAAIYCDPYDIKSIASAMERVLKLNQNEKNEIIKRGFEQCEKFGWEKCAKQVLEILEKNANKD